MTTRGDLCHDASALVEMPPTGTALVYGVISKHIMRGLDHRVCTVRGIKAVFLSWGVLLHLLVKVRPCGFQGLVEHV